MGESSDKQSKPDLEEFDWLQYRDAPQEDNSLTSFVLKNPLVPIGIISTTAFLGFGLRTLVTGDRVLSQSMMRARVGAQGFTVMAIVAGLFYQAAHA